MSITVKVIESPDASSNKLYEDVNSSRKVWVPISPTAPESCTPGAEDILSKMLSLRILEIPVKEFILDGMGREDSKVIGAAGKDTLTRNTLDEERHDIALNNCVKVFRGYTSKHEEDASKIAAAWVRDDSHPILKTAYLETSVFFVMLPFMRRWGSTSLRTTSIDISADEILHVRSHRQAARQVGQRPSKSLDNLRKETVAWLGEGLDFEGITQDKLLSISDNLMKRGVSSELDFTRSYQTPAFFERNNANLPKYS